MFVDPRAGSDERGTGAEGAPLRSLEAAVAAVRSRRERGGAADRATVVLREGTFHLTRTLQLSAADSGTHFQAFPGEDVAISGATVLPSSIAWEAVAPPGRPLWEYRVGSLSDGFDAAPAGGYTLAAAQKLCAATPTCLGFAYDGADPAPSGTLVVSFKYNLFYTPGGAHSTWVINRGYLPGGANLYVADLSSFPVTTPDGDITSLRVNGLRGVRARYPNVPTAELLGAMQILADKWTAQVRVCVLTRRA